MQLDKHERNKLIGKILKSTDTTYSDNPELISRLSEFKEKSIPMSSKEIKYRQRQPIVEGIILGTFIASAVLLVASNIQKLKAGWILSGSLIAFNLILLISNNLLGNKFKQKEHVNPVINANHQTPDLDDKYVHYIFENDSIFKVIINRKHLLKLRIKLRFCHLLGKDKQVSEILHDYPNFIRLLDTLSKAAGDWHEKEVEVGNAPDLMIAQVKTVIYWDVDVTKLSNFKTIAHQILDNLDKIENKIDTNIIGPSVNDIADEIIKSGDSDLMKLLPQNVRNKYADKILNDAIK